MKATLPNIRKLAGRGRTEDSAGSGDINTNEIANRRGGGTQAAAVHCRCSSCCPTWRRTAQCGWTG